MRVERGDIVDLVVRNTCHEHEYWKGRQIKIKNQPLVLFEDEHMMAVSKPPFMATHPTGRHLFNCVTVWFEFDFGKKAYSVHRLDRETSGILILAKDSVMARELGVHFETGNVKKCYFFISIAKKIPPPKFTAHERLERKESQRTTMTFHPGKSVHGKEAQTTFRILHVSSPYVLGLAFPKTGRSHQIRVHAKAHGLPLLGDKLYLGSPALFGRFKDNQATQEDHDLMELPRHALHATALKISGRFYRSPLPSDLVNWIGEKIKCPIKELEEKIDGFIKEEFELF